MWTMSRVEAYDAMGLVVVTVSVRQQEEGIEGATRAVLQRSTVLSSVGETDPREWLRDALIGLLEDL